MPDELDEAAYLRAVEDFFAAARGVPHVLSPKDVHLLLTWWREEVPLAAVTGGIAEVFARRRAESDTDPTVSLSYCRHAVRRQAKHLAEMRAGAHEGGTEPADDDTGTRLAELASALRGAAETQRDGRPGVATVLDTVADQVDQAQGLPAAALDEHLFSLEAALLQGCWSSLPEDDRAALQTEAEAAAVASGALGDALDRVTRAMADRALRHHLDLPHLRLG